MAHAHLLLMLAALFAQQPAAAPATRPALDYDFFRTRVQPIFLAKRPGHARCYTCHRGGAGVRYLQPLAPGATAWDEEQSQKNFQAVSRLVVAGDPMQSMLLRHPLAEKAGGDRFHEGGKHFTSQDNPEWQTFFAWVRGDTLSSR